MGYYYVCEIGQKAFEAKRARPGDLSPEMIVTIHGGAVAMCPVPHPGLHCWRQEIGTEEERAAREYGVVYLTQGQDAPPVGQPWRSSQGYAEVVGKSPAVDGGTYVLVKYLPAVRPPA